MMKESHVSESEDEREESSPLLAGPSGHRGHYQKSFPFLRARVVSVVVPMLLSSAFASRDMLLAQYLVDRLGHDQNKTQEHANPCHSNQNSTGAKNVNDLEAQTADLMSEYALIQTIPAFFACLVFGSYSDFLGRRLLLLVPIFTGVFKLVMTSLIIRLHLSLKYMLLAYAVDGLAGSWFTVLLALYSVTADINTGKKSRTLSILSIICLSSVAQAGVSVATSDLISSLGFFYASLLISCIGGVAFVIPLVLMPETLHCQKPRVYNTQTSEEKYQDPTDPPPPPDDDCQLLGSEPSTSQDWLNPLTHLRRLFGFYVIDGTVRQRAEMIIFLLIFMFPVANEINLGAIDALYQMHRPFCWGPKEIGTYTAIRAGGSYVLGSLWTTLLQKCLPFEVIGMLGCLFQGVCLAFEAFITHSWQFYLLPSLLIPSASISAIVRGLMSMRAKPSEQGALFSSIAVVECLCTLVSTTSYNKVYSLTLSSSVPGAVYLLMASCSLVAVVLYIIYFCIRERRS